MVDAEKACHLCLRATPVPKEPGAYAKSRGKNSSDDYSARRASLAERTSMLLLAL